MRALVTGAQMKEIDSYAIQTIGIPSMVLMERAALAVADEIEDTCRVRDVKSKGAESHRRHQLKNRVLVLCGTGNNGADGAAIARILYLRGWSVTVLTVGDGDNRTEEMTRQLAIDDCLGIPLMEFSDFIPGSYEVAVDALFGVGLSRTLKGEFKEAVDLLEKLQTEWTVSVDIPSGIHSDTGEVMGAAVSADLTVTFGSQKLGTALYPGKDFCGRVVVADIGFPRYKEDWKQNFYTYEKSDLSLIPSRKPNSHKGMYGKVLIAAGSLGMCGAAYLSALSAYRTGAGLVKILTVEGNAGILQSLLPEAIISSYSPESEEEEPEVFKALVEQECAWAGIIVLGPGLGKARHVEKLVEYVLLSAYVPIIIDADALNAIADNPYLTDFFTENVIVTPHIGEMSRLVGKEPSQIKADLINTALEYTETYGVTCVLKDAVTVVSGKNGGVYVNTSGGSGMAKAGSGDVLTGIIAGLIALGLTEDEAAPMGVYLHGLAGETAADRHGEHSLLAGEITSFIMQEDRA